MELFSDCLDLDEEALLPLGELERDPALVDLAEDDLESALDDLAVEFSDPSLLASALAEEFDLDLEP